MPYAESQLAQLAPEWPSRWQRALPRWRPTLRYRHTARQRPSIKPALIWPVVHKGDTGLRVNAVQILLIQRHVELTVDGKFGPQTEAAVKSFQARHGLSPSGKVGAKTWQALIVPLLEGQDGAPCRPWRFSFKYSVRLLVPSVDGKFGPMVNGRQGFPEEVRPDAERHRRRSAPGTPWSCTTPSNRRSPVAAPARRRHRAQVRRPA